MIGGIQKILATFYVMLSVLILVKSAPLFADETAVLRIQGGERACTVISTSEDKIIIKKSKVTEVTGGGEKQGSQEVEVRVGEAGVSLSVSGGGVRLIEQFLALDQSGLLRLRPHRPTEHKDLLGGRDVEICFWEDSSGGNNREVIFYKMSHGPELEREVIEEGSFFIKK